MKRLKPRKFVITTRTIRKEQYHNQYIDYSKDEIIHLWVEFDLECILELVLLDVFAVEPDSANIGILVRSKSLMFIVRPRFTGIRMVATCLDCSLVFLDWKVLRG